MGKGQDLDKQFAAKVKEEPPRQYIQVPQETHRKHVGKRSKVKALKELPERTWSKPPMRGRLCMNCDQTCVWDHRREVWECPQCHPDAFTDSAGNWPTALYNAAKKLLPVNYALGFAPDFGWFVYRDAKAPATGYERLGKFETGPMKAVKAVM